MNNNWKYYGMFFDDNTKNTLIKKAQNLVDILYDWNLYADHMTIIYNDGDTSKKKTACLPLA